MRNLLYCLTLSICCLAPNAIAKPNVLLICVDDLRPELRSFGVDYIHSPHIDSLADQGRAFHRHYVQAPTCGASRYALLTGNYGPADNRAIFKRAELLAENPQSVTPSMPAWFRQHGYTTVSVGKVSHHPGGLGGDDWDDISILEMPHSWDRTLMPSGAWQHPRGAMHGLAHGEIRVVRSEMDVYQDVQGPDTIYPDGLITKEALNQLEILAQDNQPFFLAVGIIRPHLPFGAPTKYLEYYNDVELPPTPHPEKPEGLSTWHESGEFFHYNRWDKDPRSDQAFAHEVRKYYAASVTYADSLIGDVLHKLDSLNLRENTIIVLWGDHGWHLGEHAIWGKHALFEESLRSPLIIAYPELSQKGKSTNALAESIDIFPTLTELAGIATPEFTQGKSLTPILKDPRLSGDPVVGYFRGDRYTLRTDRYRLITHPDGQAELYDHDSPEGETVNLAENNPELVNKLKAKLKNQFKK